MSAGGRPRRRCHHRLSTCATLSLTEAAKVLGVHRSTAWELYKRDEFPVPVLQIGNRLRVTKHHLSRLLLADR
ncbi:MAG: helix-turn-helix domain-containing protein [Candidatus Microthrix sp.]|nr:helix-turn-helix domain-containing protein [Candidatus Microthrix sp.]